MKKELKKAISIKLDTRIIDEIDNICVSTGLTRTAVISLLLSISLKNVQELELIGGLLNEN